ncbi:MAG: UDP-N-acetylmuramoyl-L-alanyl-D-glutamate--2,6-diaminopimelate ligase [Actinomycetota bacterium]|nr:UDP-N-acetylmuramoyl-L-alanyl-D-glutamate--2,6-diaminopimelate ligase [Actinomycetota bacterium]
MVALSRPTQLPPVALSRLVALLGAQLEPGHQLVEVSGVTLRSSEVRPGDLFAALPGANTHGIAFAAAAGDAGAVAILTDPAGAAYGSTVDASLPCLVVVADPRAVLGQLSAAIYGDPSRRLAVLGLTGTNGKTTTSYLLEAALRAAGQRPGLIGTIETRMDTADGPVAVPAQRTTPEAPDLQATLALMVENGVDSVAMEVSSHALALDRVAGTGFEVAGFTNFSQDHLDFHGDLEAYFAAKALLFDGRAKYEVVLTDDEWGRRLLRPNTVTVSAGEQRRADWYGSDVLTHGGATAFVAHGPGERELQVRLGLPGDFNVANALVALAMLDCAGYDVEQGVRGLEAARVPGRMEVVAAGQPFTAVVDYAHTPAAVATVLRALRPQTDGAVILVLGCGGDRDAGKRPLMGKVAARGSDVLIITDDNPRSEDPAAIRAAMREGAQSVDAAQRGAVVEVDGRSEAIEAAVDRAVPGDIVVIAGKGHEQGQEIAGVTTPFDDRQILRTALAAHGWSGGQGP